VGHKLKLHGTMLNALVVEKKVVVLISLGMQKINSEEDGDLISGVAN